MGRVFQEESIEWQPVRPDVTHGIFGRTLLAGETKVVLTRVDPGGKFQLHSDPYDHLFYFLRGEGVVRIKDEESRVENGVVVHVSAGELHSYINTGRDSLLLLSMNLSST